LIALVTGASGFIGARLCRRLLEDGHQVRAMVRQTSERFRLEGAAVDLVFADMTDASTLPGALDGVTHVFHCAASLGAPTQEAFNVVNEAGTRSFVQAVLDKADRIERFILISSVAAGGPSRPERPRLESDPAEPISNYGRSKLAGEQQTSPLAGKVDVAIVRPPAVYGPTNIAMRPLFRGVKRRVHLEVAGPRRMMSFVHVDDLVDGIVLAGTHADAAGEVFHVIGPQDGTLGDFQVAIATALGIEPIKLYFPGPALMAAGWLADKLKQADIIKTSFGVDKVREGTVESWVVSGDKATQRLGYVPTIRLADGVADTIRDYTNRGWL